MSTPKLYPQTLSILTHLIRVGSISNVEAHSMYKCRALPRRISDLKANGVAIRKEQKKDATGQRYVRYHLLTE